MRLNCDCAFFISDPLFRHPFLEIVICFRNILVTREGQWVSSMMIFVLDAVYSLNFIQSDLVRSP